MARFGGAGYKCFPRFPHIMKASSSLWCGPAFNVLKDNVGTVRWIRQASFSFRAVWITFSIDYLLSTSALVSYAIVAWILGYSPNPNVESLSSNKITLQHRDTIMFTRAQDPILVPEASYLKSLNCIASWQIAKDVPYVEKRLTYSGQWRSSEKDGLFLYARKCSRAKFTKKLEAIGQAHGSGTFAASHSSTNRKRNCNIVIESDLWKVVIYVFKFLIYLRVWDTSCCWRSSLALNKR